ncbi:hypothetical protein AK812_SmicGene38895 [Symbiodinium microadriaticum]|uniref:Uncharacterized protein n=1 Tax=Symbiodinium microadriaticum TaxID=2951 RepID=A0A1Q9CCK7_SYMMI|nr:hypothetical protein AK812_SmicGene38895 [Symbiodinium microadriaticum]
MEVRNGWKHIEKWEAKAAAAAQDPNMQPCDRIPKAAPTLEAWLAPHSASEETAEPQAAHQAYKAPPASFQVRDPAPAFAPQETPVQQADSSPKVCVAGWCHITAPTESTARLVAVAGVLQATAVSQAAAAFDLPKQAFGLDAPVAMKAPPIPQEATPPKQKMPPMPVTSPQAECWENEVGRIQIEFVMETLAVASCFGAAFELWVDRARGSVIVWMGFLGARANAWMGLVDCRLNFPQLEALDAHQGSHAAKAEDAPNAGKFPTGGNVQLCRRKEHLAVQALKSHSRSDADLLRGIKTSAAEVVY